MIATQMTREEIQALGSLLLSIRNSCQIELRGNGKYGLLPVPHPDARRAAYLMACISATSKVLQSIDHAVSEGAIDPALLRAQ